MDHSSVDRVFFYQDNSSALRLMVIMAFKRQAFKSPLPGYKSEAGEMERWHNGLEIE